MTPKKFVVSEDMAAETAALLGHLSNGDWGGLRGETAKEMADLLARRWERVLQKGSDDEDGDS
jgi:hypothetical protein